MVQRYEAGKFFKENFSDPKDDTDSNKGATPWDPRPPKPTSSNNSAANASGASTGTGGGGASPSAYYNEGARQQQEREAAAEEEFDIWQDNIHDSGGTGQGGSPSSRDSGEGGQNSPGQYETVRTTREERSAAAAPCDDDNQQQEQRNADTALTALPIGVYASESPSEEFVFDQYPAMQPVGIDSPDRPPAQQGWYSSGFAKHNRMLPSQYYYDSLIATPYILRNPDDQKDVNINLGSAAFSNVNLTDNLRYVLGCIWEASSLRTGTPKTALMIASDWKILDPAAQDFFDSLARRGLFFFLYPSAETGISSENLSAFSVVGSDTSINTPNDRSRRPSYVSKLKIMTNMSLLKKMKIANPSVFEADFNVFEYLNDLTKFTPTYGSTGGQEEQTSRIIYEHTFRAPTGYPRSELELARYDVNTINKDIVSITSHNRTREQFYTNTHENERNKESIYRAFKHSYGVEDSFAGENPTTFETDGIDNDEAAKEYLLPTREDVIQKFPSSQVKMIKNINTFIVDQSHDPTEFTQVAGQTVDVPFDFWLNKNLTNYNLISFKMNHRSDLALLMQKCSLDTLLLELVDITYPFKETYFAQILDTVINRNSELTVQEQLDKSSINLRPNEIKDPINLMKSMVQLDNTDEQGVADVRNTRFDISAMDGYSYPLAYDGISDNEGKNINLANKYAQMLNKALVDNIMKGELPNWSNILIENSFEQNFSDLYGNLGISQIHRRASQIVGGTKCHSEVLAYRVIKLDAETEEMIQEYYFFNTQSVEHFQFIDSQVLPGKRYIYRIFTINFVVGSEYNYLGSQAEFRHSDMPGDLNIDGSFETRSVPFDNTIGQRISPSFVDGEFLDPVRTDGQEPSTLDYNTTMEIDIPLRVFPSFRIIEAPYYEQVVTTMDTDRPPLSPDVQVANSYRTSKQNQSAVMIYPFSRFGFEKAAPIIMSERDRPQLSAMLNAQQRNGNIQGTVEEIQYRSDTAPERYEMFYTFDPPENYSSFSRTGSRLTTTEDRKFFDLDLPFNVKVYVTFRSVDLAGFSNPGPIFELTRHNYGDGTYTTFEPYEMAKKKPYIYCNRFVSVEPATQQRVFNIENESGQISFESVPADLQSITLGKSINEEDLLWGRRFKFRFTSANSYNSFDINCEFGYDKMQLGEDADPIQSPSTSFGNLADKNRRAQRIKNSAVSSDRLNKPLSDAGSVLVVDPSSNNLPAPDVLEDQTAYGDPIQKPDDIFIDPAYEPPRSATGPITTEPLAPISSGGGGAPTTTSTGGGGGNTADLRREYEERQRRDRPEREPESQY